MSDEGRLVADRYRVVRRIGSGAMGAVWQAHDEVLHRTVAIKQLLLQPGLDEHEAEDARQRTMREGRIAARLHHPNAITVFDVVTDDNGQPCLIMEYLPSTSLAQELQQHKTLPPIEVARIGAQIAAALKDAHAVGIVHRDIKPGNILLAGNGVVKITDFGISRATDDVTVTKTGMIAGTPAYLAPEVAIGGDPGPESDVFSLGSTLYAAAEGQPPFGLSENTLGLLHAVAAGQINPPRRSGPLTSALAVMLHPDVAHRPTATQCEELLAAVSRGETPIGGPNDDDGPATAVLGAAGAGAVGGVLGGAAADYADGHTGRLDDGYDDQYTDEYGDGYPDEDYYGEDYYGEAPAPTSAERSLDPRDPYGANDYDRTAVAPAPAPTRTVPVGAAGYDYDDYDNYNSYDGYNGYDDPPDDPDRRAAAAPAPEEKSNWKVPAAIGAVVVAGMVAFVIWVFGGSSGEDGQTDPADQNPLPPTTSEASTSDSPSQTTTTTTSEVVDSIPVEPTDQNPGGPVEEVPPPTDDEQDTSPTSTSVEPTTPSSDDSDVSPTTTDSETTPVEPPTDGETGE